MQKEGKDQNDETSALLEITEAMRMAGLMAFQEWRERRKSDPELSRSDLVTAIYIAMRRASKRR